MIPKIRLLQGMTSQRSLLGKWPILLQFAFLFAIILSFSSAFSLIAMSLIKPLYGIVGADRLLLEASSNPDLLKEDMNKINALKFIQLFTTIGTFLFPAFIFSFIREPLGDFIRLKSGASLLFFLAALVLILISAPMIGMFYEWNQAIQLPGELMNLIQRSEEQASSLTTLFLLMPNLGDLGFNLLVIGIIPALAEEFLFRGVMQRLIQDRLKNAHVAIWITAAVFSLVHFQFLGFVPRMLLGAILGYTFYLSNTIWVPVAAHALNNSAQVIMSYLFQHHITSYDIESEEHTPIYLGLLSLLCCVAIIVWMFRFLKSQPEQQPSETPAEES